MMIIFSENIVENVATMHFSEISHILNENSLFDAAVRCYSLVEWEILSG